MATYNEHTRRLIRWIDGQKFSRTGTWTRASFELLSDPWVVKHRYHHLVIAARQHGVVFVANHPVGDTHRGTFNGWFRLAVNGGSRTSSKYDTRNNWSRTEVDPDLDHPPPSTAVYKAPARMFDPFVLDPQHVITRDDVDHATRFEWARFQSRVSRYGLSRMERRLASGRDLHEWTANSWARSESETRSDMNALRGLFDLPPFEEIKDHLGRGASDFKNLGKLLEAS